MRILVLGSFPGLASLAARLGVGEERIVSDVARLGNTSCASAFIALCGAARAGRFEPGRDVLILAFGAGFTWGAVLCRVDT